VKKVAKKVAAKVSAKTAKKAVSKLVKAPKMTVEVFLKRQLGKAAPETKHFILKGGKHLKTVYELMDELEQMTEDTFREHVNEAKNDFSNWINDVLGMKDLAEEIKKTNTRMDMQHKMLKRLYDELKKAAK
jgi:flavoprotein